MLLDERLRPWVWLWLPWLRPLPDEPLPICPFEPLPLPRLDWRWVPDCCCCCD